MKKEETTLIDQEEKELRKRIGEVSREKVRLHVKRDDLMSYGTVFVIFLLIALAVFIPITLNMNSVAPGTGGDAYQNLWDIWWVGYSTFTLHTSMWYTSLVFPPLGANLAFQTMSPIGSLISVPFQLIGNIFAYNVLFFLGFAVSGLTMFTLAEYLTGNRYAAFIAGLVFSFSSFHFILALSHINWMFIAWVPLSVYFFLKMIRHESRWASIGLALSLVLTIFMGDIEQGIMLVEALVLIFAAYLVFKETRKRIFSKSFWISVGIFVVAALVIGSFGFIPMIQAIMAPNALSQVNQLNTIQNVQIWSDNLLSFFAPSPFNGFFSGASSSYLSIFGQDPYETISYVGYIVIILSAYGIYKSFRSARLWIALALIFAWMAIGPYLLIGNINTGVPGIYYLYHYIPFLNVIREPGRFDLIVTMSVAVLAAIGTKAMLDLKELKKYAKITIAMLTIVIMAESAGIMTQAVSQVTTTNIQVPSVYYGIANSTGNFTVLNLPALANQYTSHPGLYIGKSLFYTSITHKPTVSGLLTRQNTSQDNYLFNIPLVIQTYNLQNSGQLLYSSPINESYMDQTILTLYNYNVGVIAVDSSAFNQSDTAELLHYLTPVFGTPVLSNSTYVYVTAQAINRSVFRNYVSYPILSEWGSQYGLINGSTVNFWVPLGYGAVIVYAPYADVSNLQQKVVGGALEPINTTISFSAEAYGSQVPLYIEYLNPQGNLQKVAQVNLTSTLQDYSVRTVLLSGQRYPNTVLFVSGNTSSNYALLSNIQFSKSG